MIFNVKLNCLSIFLSFFYRRGLITLSVYFVYRVRHYFLLVCLGVFVPVENFSLIWSNVIIGEMLQILTFVRHLRPLSSESSLAFITNCDIGHPFVIFNPVDMRHPRLLPNFMQWSCHYLL